MYIGIDLIIHYSYKKDGIRHERRSLFKQAKKLNEFRKELENTDSSDFISAQVIHKKTGVNKKVSSREELIQEIYKYMTYTPNVQ